MVGRHLQFLASQNVPRPHVEPDRLGAVHAAYGWKGNT